jgi:hypothetical protein
VPAAKPWQAETPVQVALFKTEQKGPLSTLKDNDVARAPARVTSASEPLVAVTADPTHVPTPDEIFGADPFVSNPEGTFLDWYSGQQRSYGFNRHYFATESAANILAERLGGTVVQANSILGDSGYFSQTQPNRMIRFPNGREVNAGIVASFYTHGYPQSYIDRLIANEIDPEGNYQNLATPVSIVRNGMLTSRSSIQSGSA